VALLGSPIAFQPCGEAPCIIDGYTPAPAVVGGGTTAPFGEFTWMR